MHQIERGTAGVTVKAALPDDVTFRPFAQVSGRTGRKGSQLPKLRAHGQKPTASEPHQSRGLR